MNFFKNIFAKKNEKQDIEFKRYEPENPVQQKTENVYIQEVVLLNTEEEIQKTGITVEDISQFSQVSLKHLQTICHDSQSHGSILLQIQIFSHQNPEIQLAMQENIDDDVLQNFYDFLSKQMLNTKQGNMSWQIIFKVFKNE